MLIGMLITSHICHTFLKRFFIPTPSIVVFVLCSPKFIYCTFNSSNFMSDFEVALSFSNFTRIKIFLWVLTISQYQFLFSSGQLSLCLTHPIFSCNFLSLLELIMLLLKTIHLTIYFRPRRHLHLVLIPIPFV